YIDIQFCLSGHEEIGWKPTDSCCGAEGFDEEKDLGFFTDESEAWSAVGPGRFAIYFPADAHAPLGGAGPVHKVVVKVAAE
ncbi:MAG: YhcH/YjgK/YiaL family protein, partial [Verrucomicrobiota bacterium]|nr:YhcH/YjgK/YiaL family protein [Verrucomicrobiota bacterium]